jgi:hypothetical protein
MKKQELPTGWNEQRVKEYIVHYENQTEDEEFAEIEAALKADDITLMAIPNELVPEVRAVLARKQASCEGRPGRGGRKPTARPKLQCKSTNNASVRKLIEKRSMAH